MRIAHLVGHQGLNGVSTSCVMLANEQAKAGHDVFAVVPHESWIARQAFHPSISIIRTSYKMRFSELWHVLGLLRSWKADVLHCHGSKANKSGMIYRMFAGAPVVMTAHSRQFQLPWPAAHVVIAPSAETAAYYHRRFLAWRKSTRIIANLFAASHAPGATPERRAEARAMLGLDKDDFVIGAVGHLQMRKNQIGMLRIARRLKAQGIKVRLLLAGAMFYDNSPQEQAIQREISADPLVLLAGIREDIAAVLPAMDVFLMLSSREEAPVGPLEAMAQGIPVLSYRVGNMADLTPEGLLFEQGDEIGATKVLARLAADPQARAAAGAAGRVLVVERLAPSVILPQIDEAYRDAIGRARRWRSADAPVAYS